MEKTSANTLKILKGFFSLSIVVYAVMGFLIENVVLMDTEGGFVTEAGDPAAQQYLYLFSGMAFMMFVLQFILPSKIKVEPNASIIRYALCEAIGVFGFILYLMTALWIPSAILLGIALFTLLFLDRRAQAAL